MSKYARLDSMIVTILFFASFSVKGYLHHHFSGLFGGIITDFYFYRFTNDFCVTLSVTTLKIIFLLLFSSVWGHFGIFLGQLWCEVLYFLKTVQYYFHGIVLQIFETLWPYFMNWIQLFQVTEPLRWKSLLLTANLPEGPGLCITPMVLVLLRIT